MAMWGGNPVNWVDPLGLEAGDKFLTPTETAIDVLDQYNKQSIKENLEYSGHICKCKNDPDYFATQANRGVANTVIPKECPENSITIAKYHTHGDYSKKNFTRTTKKNDQLHSDNFSKADKFADTLRNTIDPTYIGGYLGTPSTHYYFYNPSSNNVSRIK